jgi:hypothetical protein
MLSRDMKRYVLFCKRTDRRDRDMTEKKNLSFTLSIGTWRCYFMNKKTLERLSSDIVIKIIHDKTEINIVVPDDLKNNKDVVVQIERIR